MSERINVFPAEPGQEAEPIVEQVLRDDPECHRYSKIFDGLSPESQEIVRTYARTEGSNHKAFKKFILSVSRNEQGPAPQSKKPQYEFPF